MSELEGFEGHVRDLYRRVLGGWNRASGTDFAAPFAEDGEVIGFDGSQTKGRTTIADEMDGIFADHATGKYVAKVRSVRSLGSDAAVLSAIAGVVPAEEKDLNPALNSIQTLVFERSGGGWRVVLYQNTPAQLHGRPELVESLTNELRQELQTGA